MSKARTPQYFPHMKIRGARRRRIAPFQRLAGSFDRLANSFVIFNEVIAAFPNIRITNGKETI